MSTEPIETINDCMVSIRGDDIIVIFPRSRMSHEVALRMAAWIVALADESPEHQQFRDVLNAVENT